MALVILFKILSAHCALLIPSFVTGKYTTYLSILSFSKEVFEKVNKCKVAKKTKLEASLKRRARRRFLELAGQVRQLQSKS